jgi:UDPglucose 6-dehydrogenase
MINPYLVLIGSYSRESGHDCAKLVKSYMKTKPYFAFSSAREVEIAKTSVNSYVTTKMSSGNSLSELCQATGSASASRVLDSIGADSRIGKRYSKLGAPYSGPCFARDNIAPRNFAESLGVRASIAISKHDVNQRQTSRILDSVLSQGASIDVVMVDVAYKPGTAVLEESPSITFAM